MLYSVMISRIMLLFVMCHSSLSKGDYSEPELIEDDIVLDDSIAFAVVDHKSPVKRRGKRDISQNTIKIWDDAVIPYVITDDMSMTGRKVIRKAFRNIVRRTCLRFIPKQDHHTDYVKFITGRKGCYSSIGRKGGEQVISLGDGCLDRKHAIHEVMHTLGFFHEHSRFDRDKYIKILWWNIQKGMEHNFLSYRHYPADSLNEPYDLFSIMHYNNKAFSSNGQDTIRSRSNPYLRLGKVKSLSNIDTKQLIKMYGCSTHKLRAPAPCRNSYKRCHGFAIRTDSCESMYEFMKFYCPRACAFC